MDVVIKNGRVASADGIYAADLAIKGRQDRADRWDDA